MRHGEALPSLHWLGLLWSWRCCAFGEDGADESPYGLWSGVSSLAVATDTARDATYGRRTERESGSGPPLLGRAIWLSD